MLASAANVPACGCMADVLLRDDCVLVVCVAVIGWSGRAVWVSRHEQGVS